MNFDQAITFVLLRSGNHAKITYDKAGELLNTAHSQVLEEEEWSRKKTEIIINTAAQNSTGTFSIVNGASTALGTSLTLSANNLGWYIKFGTDTAVYVIGAFSVATITLKDFKGNTVTYAGTTATATTFIAWKRWYSLGEAIEGIDAVIYDRELAEATTERLDDIDRDRQSTSENPRYYALGPRNSAGYQQIEFWPRPTGTIAVRLNARKGHTDLQGTNIPIVPYYVIAWKASEDACLYLAAITNQASWALLGDKFGLKYEATKKRALEQDQKKYGLPHQVRDVAMRGARGDDFSISHDDEFWG